ncbi:MAG: hypothetical protein ACLR0U_31180 [Enterocloster clostridioformis]
MVYDGDGHGAPMELGPCGDKMV